jgi:hypothetical protein
MDRRNQQQAPAQHTLPPPHGVSVSAWAERACQTDMASTARVTLGARVAQRQGTAALRATAVRPAALPRRSLRVNAAKTADGPRVAIAGVTGAVGQEFLEVSAQLDLSPTFRHTRVSPQRPYGCRRRVFDISTAAALCDPHNPPCMPSAPLMEVFMHTATHSRISCSDAAEPT